VRTSVKLVCIATLFLVIAIVAWGVSSAIEDFSGSEASAHAESVVKRSSSPIQDSNVSLPTAKAVDAAQGLLVVRQAVLFVHLMVFAFAIVAILQEDFSLLRAAQFDVIHLQRTGKMIIALLAALWGTGLILVAMDVGWDFAALAQNPKLAVKLTVVSLLTLNGVFLHFIAFPTLSRDQSAPKWGARLCALLGVFSSVSWMFASFVGVSRLVAPMLNYTDFLLLYGLLLATGAVVAISLVSPRLETLIAARRAMQT
jgi:hypothetical protein